MGDSCLFCLEETSQDNLVILVDFTTYADVPCSCRLYSHVGCWMSYYMSKGGFECPICHSKIVVAPSIEPQQVIVRIVEAPPEEYRCSRTTRMAILITPLVSLILLVALYLRNN